LKTCGVIAQLGERLHGMQEVVGSIPSGSTTSPFSFQFETLASGWCPCADFFAKPCKKTNTAQPPLF
jgi:hypothetical protein